MLHVYIIFFNNYIYIYIVSTIHRASELAEKTIDFMIIDKKLAIVKKKMIEKEKEKLNEKTY